MTPFLNVSACVVKSIENALNLCSACLYFLAPYLDTELEKIECPNFPSPSCTANGDIKSFPSRTHCFTSILPTANSIIGLKHSYCYETTLKNNLSLHKDKILVCPCARTQISSWIYEYILFFSFPFETTYLFRFFTPCTIN